MPIGSTGNITGLSADARMRFINNTALMIVANTNPFLHMLMGKPLYDRGWKDVPDSMPQGDVGFSNLDISFAGKQFEYRLAMVVDEPDFVGYLDPADAYAAANWSYQSKRANAKGNFARLILPYSFDPIMNTLVAGDGVRFLKEESNTVAEGFERKLGRAVHGIGDATDKSILGWQLALGGATGSMLGIDMSDPDNVDFTAQSYNVNGNLSFRTLGFIRNEAVNKGGRPNLGVCTKTDMNYVEQVMEGKWVPDDNEDPIWRKFQGMYQFFKGCRFVMDSYHPLAGTIPMIDTRGVTCYMQQTGFGLSDTVRLPHVMAVEGQFVQALFQVVYNDPKKSVRGYGITGAA